MVKGRNDIKFSSPYISELKFLVNENFNGEFDGDLESNISINSDKIEEQEDKNIYLSSLKITLGKESEEYPFYIELKMSGKFHLFHDSDIDENNFLEYNAPAILYSYARPIVSDVITRSGFPPFNLPFMNFMELESKENKD